MIVRPAQILLFALLTLLLATGCSRTDAPAATEEPTRPAAEPATAEPATEDVASNPLEGPGDPAAAVDGWFAALADGRADAMVGAVPTQFRNDVDRWLVGWLRSVDPAARREAADAVGKFAETLREKQAFVLGSDRVTIAGPATEFLRQHYEPVCRIVAAVARWPGWGEQSLTDSRELIAAVLAAIAAEPTLVDQLRQLEVTTQSHSGKAALVTITSRGESEGHDLRLTMIGDRWVPAGLAERWDEIRHFVADSRSDSDTGSDDSRQLRGLTRQLNDMSAAIAEVTTQPEFDSLANRAATLLLAAAARAEEAPRPVEPHEFVTVQIEGPLTEAEKDQLLWNLVSQTDEPQSGLADSVGLADGKGMIVTVGPVADLKAYAARLPRLKVERLDAEKRTITVRHAAP